MKTHKAWACVAAAMLLAACGGGGGGGDAPPADPQRRSTASVAGLYTGTAARGGSLDALILGDGRMYAMVGSSGGQGVATIFFGSGTVTASGFTSAVGGNLDTHSGASLTAGSVTLTGQPKTSIAGTLSGNGVPIVDFDLPYSTAFEGTATLADVAGSYFGDSTGLGRIISASITVDASGAITGESPADGCVHSGTLTPNASANVFDLSLTFGDNCPKKGELRGHALWNPASGTAARNADDVRVERPEPPQPRCLGLLRGKTIGQTTTDRAAAAHHRRKPPTPWRDAS